MATVTGLNSFTAGTPAKASEVNNNFSVIKTFVESLSTAANLDALSISTSKIADYNVTEIKIANSSITSAKIADGTIVAGDIADGAVTSAKILDGTIVEGDIADGAITSSKIFNGTIVNEDIADSTIAKEKIASGPRGLIVFPTPQEADITFNNTEVSSGLSATFTAVASRYYRITYHEPQVQSGSGTFSIPRLKLGSVPLQQTVSSNAVGEGTTVVYVGTFTAGSKTINTTLQSFTSTSCTAFRTSTSPAQLTVEDIGTI